MALIPRKKADSGRVVNRFTLIASEISAKEVTLTQAPSDANSVILDLPCGTVQVLDVDYEIISDKLSWDGLGLETIIEIDDKIIVTYS